MPERKKALKSEARRMWGGRFEKAPDRGAEEFSRSLHYDCRLAIHDIRASEAHAGALKEAGILSERERKTLVKALAAVRKTVLDESADFTTGEEDIHTWVENRLREKTDELADKLHTGRSRNDQVAQDFRLYLGDETEKALKKLKRLKGALLGLAEKYQGTVALGHTHLQPAQPVLLSHHLLAYFEMFHRDSDRLKDCLSRTSLLTLGSGALAGTAIPIDRRRLARSLDLGGITRNSMDAVADRDFTVEFAAAASLIMVHLSRLSEELIIWSHPDIGWAEISEEFCTGSSLMPQKRNPDMPELTRGKTGRVIGHLMGLLVMLKGLPLAYNRDLQEDKEAVFDIVDTLHSSIDVMAALLDGLTFRTKRIVEAARLGFSTATDLAEYLALAGVPFRQAHHIVGSLVRYCNEEGKAPEELTLEELKRFSSRFDKNALRLLSVEASVGSKNVPGGTAPRRVRAAIKAARKRNV